MRIIFIFSFLLVGCAQLEGIRGLLVDSLMAPLKIKVIEKQSELKQVVIEQHELTIEKLEVKIAELEAKLKKEKSSMKKKAIQKELSQYKRMRSAILERGKAVAI